MTPLQASAFVAEHFGIDAEAGPLASYDDENFSITTPDGRRFVLKVTSPATSRELIEAQSRVTQLLDERLPHYDFPSVVPTSTGDAILPLDAEDGTRHARLLRFVDGDLLCDVPYDDGLLTGLGRLLGEMDRALAEVDSLALAGRRLPWNVAHFDLNEPLSSYICDAYDRTLVAYFQVQHSTFVRPRLQHLRRSVIHGDGNDWNVVVRDGRITGIIDFGDAVHTHTIVEVAVAATYAMMGQPDPLATACRILSAYHDAYPIHEAELALLYYLIAARLCISVSRSALARDRGLQDPYYYVSEAPAWQLLHTLHATNPVAAEHAFRAACGYVNPRVSPAADAMARRQAHVSRALSVSYDAPIRMERAALQHMYDDGGNTYLDCVNNVCHLGHCHPAVVRAEQRQAAWLNTNTRYLYDLLDAYTARLAATLPAPLEVVFLVNAGSAATDLALRLAQVHTGRRDLVVVEHGYHGNTMAAIEASSYKFDGPGGNGRAPHVHVVGAPGIYRGAHRGDERDAGSTYAVEVHEAIERLDQAGRPVGAFLCESVLGCAGQIFLPEGYLASVYPAVRRAGGLCIADEVQVGFGRLGTHFWGFQRQGVVPDVVIMGKPIGNGYPLAAVATTRAVAASFENGMEFFSSFGGNPVACSVGLAVLDVIERDGLMEHARQVGDVLLGSLQGLMERHHVIGDVRGAGLFLGVELVRDRSTKAPAPNAAHDVVEAMRHRGFLLSTDGPHHNVIKIKPPMVFRLEDADRLVEALDAVLSEVCSGAGR